MKEISGRHIVTFGLISSCVYILIYTRMTPQHNKDPSDPRCIATGSATFDDLDNMNVSLHQPSSYIYSDKNLKWMELLKKSLNPLNKEEARVFNASYPLNVNMRELVSTYKGGGYVSPLKVNEYPFRFIWNPSKICKTGEVFLLFLIKSAIKYFDRRQAIRQTWANNALFEKFRVRRLFLLGMMKGQNRYHEYMRNEILYYGDTLQLEFYDMYYNNTWKTRGGIQWAVTHCQNAKYVMVVDDDFFVATDLLIQLLKVNGNPNNLYMGWLNRNPTPVRKMRNKWYIPKSEFPYPVYPDFISAGAIVMSMDFAIDVHIASQYTKHFVYDDVFIGIVAYKLQVLPVSCSLFSILKIWFTADRFWRTIISHEYKPAEIRQAWKCHLLISNKGIEAGVDTAFFSS